MPMPPPRCRRDGSDERALLFQSFHATLLLVSLAARGPRAFACSGTCHKASGPVEQASQTLQPMESTALSASAPRLVFPVWAAAAANHAAWSQNSTRIRRLHFCAPVHKMPTRSQSDPLKDQAEPCT
jgi:hypothetical protein